MNIKSERWIKEHIVTQRSNSSFEMIIDYPLSDSSLGAASKFTVEMFFFPPTSLSNSVTWKKRDRFYQNLKTNLRWHTPVEEDVVFKFSKTEKYLELREKISEKEKIIEAVIGESKLFANRIIRKLKYENDSIHEQANNFLNYLQLYRQRILSPIVNDCTVHDKVIKHCSWCDEYLSYYFESFLLKHSLQLYPEWRSFLENEQLYISNNYKQYKVKCSETELRRFLQRASMLKKFVSEILFLDLKKVSKGKIGKNVAAGAAAGLAATVNFIAQYSSTYSAVNRDTDLKFSMLLIFAVIVYIFKDRVKDLSKEYFNTKIMSSEPDNKYDIISNKMPGLPPLKVGNIKENFTYTTKDKISDEVYYIWKKARNRARGSLLSHGEVLWYKKQITIDALDLKSGKNWSLKDVIRYDLRDFYTNLAVSQGSLNFFDEDEGKVELDREKSYSMDLILKLSCEKNDDCEVVYQSYRLFLEKEGLLEIDETSYGVDYYYREKQWN